LYKNIKKIEVAHNKKNIVFFHEIYSSTWLAVRKMSSIGIGSQEQDGS
jgi:hypothetical protein